jgi:hypothetical protein
MLALDPAALPGGLEAAARLTVGPNGEAHLPLAQLGVGPGEGPVTVQPLLLDPATEAVLALGEALELQP